ncbi:unnamed protein product [Brachionus calyciflorus]|uniref:Uncharacterized protein n=1 Tax=Brachionus calyciflorus TaxID=104777 RepID=A0A814RB56_9BILA|nr:unnamed protein product [Brachionus calyciflorus]
MKFKLFLILFYLNEYSMSSVLDLSSEESILFKIFKPKKALNVTNISKDFDQIINSTKVSEPKSAGNVISHETKTIISTNTITDKISNSLTLINHQNNGNIILIDDNNLSSEHLENDSEFFNEALEPLKFLDEKVKINTIEPIYMSFKDFKLCVGHHFELNNKTKHTEISPDFIKLFKLRLNKLVE